MRIAATLSSAGLLLSSLAGTPDPDALRLQTDPSGHAEPILIFVSSARLDEIARSDSVVRFEGVAVPDFRDRLRRAKAAFEEDGCTGPIAGDLPPGAEHTAWTLRDAFARRPTSFVGKVVALKAGWMLDPSAGPSGMAATQVVLVVDEVLHDETGVVKPGSRISLLEEFGAFWFDSVRFCTVDRDTTALSVGDTVAVAGSLNALDRRHIVASAVETLVIRNGVGTSVRPTGLDSSANVPLSDLKGAAASGAEHRSP